MPEAQNPSLELVIFKLDLLSNKFDDLKQETTIRHDKLEAENKALEVRIRKNEDDILRIKTIALPLGMAFSAAVSVLVKMFIDSLGK